MTLKTVVSYRTYADDGQIDNALNHKSLSHEKDHSVRDELPIIRPSQR